MTPKNVINYNRRLNEKLNSEENFRRVMSFYLLKNFIIPPTLSATSNYDLASPIMLKSIFSCPLVVVCFFFAIGVQVVCPYHRIEVFTSIRCPY